MLIFFTSFEGETMDDSLSPAYRSQFTALYYVQQRHGQQHADTSSLTDMSLSVHIADDALNIDLHRPAPCNPVYMFSSMLPIEF